MEHAGIPDADSGLRVPNVADPSLPCVDPEQPGIGWLIEEDLVNDSPLFLTHSCEISPKIVKKATWLLTNRAQWLIIYTDGAGSTELEEVD